MDTPRRTTTNHTPAASRPTRSPVGAVIAAAAIATAMVLTVLGAHADTTTQVQQAMFGNLPDIPLRTLTEVPPPSPPPTGPNPVPIPYPVVATVNLNPQRTTTAPTDELPVVTVSKHG